MIWAEWLGRWYGTLLLEADGRWAGKAPTGPSWSTPQTYRVLPDEQTPQHGELDPQCFGGRGYVRIIWGVVNSTHAKASPPGPWIGGAGVVSGVEPRNLRGEQMPQMISKACAMVRLRHPRPGKDDKERRP